MVVASLRTYDPSNHKFLALVTGMGSYGVERKYNQRVICYCPDIHVTTAWTVYALGISCQAGCYCSQMDKAGDDFSPTVACIASCITMKSSQ